MVKSELGGADQVTASMAARMTSLARPDPLKPLVVLGPAAIALMIELCRAGYQEVVCGLRAGLPCALEHSSTVLISGPVTERELKPLLQDACSVLGSRGRLVLRLASIDQDRVVEHLLTEFGVTITSGVYDLSKEVLVCHQVERSLASAIPQRRAA